MEQITSNNVNRAPGESRPLTGGSNGIESSGSNQLPVRPPLTRADSRSTFSPQAQRPTTPQQQPRPQFQPGGAVSSPPQLGPRLGTPPPRGPLNPGPPATQPIRTQVPQQRPAGPQSIAPQQGLKPQQSPTTVQPPQRAPAPNSLQFGPRQHPQFGGVTTPDGSKPFVPQTNGKQGASLSTPPTAGQSLSRQPSQGSLKGPDTSKPVNLETQNIPNDNQNISKAENVADIPGVPKGRSFSISAAPGAASPLKMEDDRRKSVSSISGRIEDFGSRSPALGLIREGKDSRDNIRGSKESVKSEASYDGDRNIPERPESHLSGSKMTESLMGSLSNLNTKKKDDNDDVILQNNLITPKNELQQNQNKTSLLDRSPSLTRSDESPEPQNASQSSVISNKARSVTPEVQRPKTPKIEVQQDLNPEPVKDVKPVETPTKNNAKSPIADARPPSAIVKKPTDFNASLISNDSKKSTPRKVSSAPKARPKDGDNDSGVDESTQGNDLNGSPGSPNKKLPSKLPTKEKSSSSLKPSLSRSSSKSATVKTPENPLPTDKKKVPMNKIQVGSAPSPNIKAVKSKIGSLENTTYKPGGGKVRIESRKIDFNKVTPKIAAKNEAYTPSGGSKKITTTKLEWNAKSKIGSLQNATYKPGGGDKKIETVKLDFKEKAKPKVASTANINHKPGGGGVKIDNQKLDFKAQSKVGSLDNVKHKPGGGDIKIFDDKEYIKQVGGQTPLPNSHNQSRQEDLIYMSMDQWEEEVCERPLTRSRSARLHRAPRTPRALSPRKIPEEERRLLRNNEINRRAARPASAREPPRTYSRRTSLTQRPAFTIY